MSEPGKTVLVEKEDGVAWVCLNRPPLNIMDGPMLGEIVARAEEFARDRELRAVVFRGFPKAFSAGVEVAEHTADKVEGMMKDFLGLFRSLNLIPAPTVAAVEGLALGGGCELALFCDLVVASSQAKFGQPEIKLGVFPPVTVPLLPWLVGRARALEVVLMGENIPAERAYEMGLVNRVFPAEEFERELRAFVGSLQEKSAAALAITKRAVDRSLYQGVMASLDEVADIYLNELMQTKDANEGLAAFLEKRPPRWANE